MKDKIKVVPIEQLIEETVMERIEKECEGTGIDPKEVFQDYAKACEILDDVLPRLDGWTLCAISAFVTTLISAVCDTKERAMEMATTILMAVTQAKEE